MTQHPNFFAIIPYHILDDERIDDSTAILFARIQSLTIHKGYCFASDKYLSEISRISEREIKNRLQTLEKYGYITRVTKKNGMLWDRKIFSNISYEGNTRSLGREHTCTFEGNICSPYINKSNINKKDKEIVSNPPKEVSKPAKESIHFDLEKESFIGIEEKHLNEWSEIYPSVDIRIELKKMVEWLLANKTRAKLKKKWREFIRRWLEKESKRASYKKKPSETGSELKETKELHSIYYSWISNCRDPYYANKQQITLESGLIKVYGKDIVLGKATPSNYVKVLKNGSYASDRVLERIQSKAGLHYGKR